MDNDDKKDRLVEVSIPQYHSSKTTLDRAMRVVGCSQNTISVVTSIKFLITSGFFIILLVFLCSHAPHDGLRATGTQHGNAILREGNLISNQACEVPKEKKIQAEDYLYH